MTDSLPELHAVGCRAPCRCKLDPGSGRGVSPKRKVLTGSFTVSPRQHVGHEVTAIAVYRIDNTPSHLGRGSGEYAIEDPCGMFRHRVRCSCGVEWDMLDKHLRKAINVGEAAL